MSKISPPTYEFKTSINCKSCNDMGFTIGGLGPVACFNCDRTVDKIAMQRYLDNKRKRLKSDYFMITFFWFLIGALFFIAFLLKFIFFAPNEFFSKFGVVTINRLI